MSLDPFSRWLIAGAGSLVLLHLLIRLIRRRSLADLPLFLLLALTLALYFLEILYLGLPLLDILLSIALGVLTGLHALRCLRFRK